MSCKNGCDRCQCGNTKGERGEKGKNGTDGAQGVAGNNGDTGPIGPTGNTGPVGPIGPSGSSGGAQFTEVLYDTNPGLFWTVPPNVTKLSIKMWAGGASGLLHETPDEVILAGGGGGQYIADIMNVSPGQIIPYVIAAQADAIVIAFPNYQGVDGNNTGFGPYVAYGGIAPTFTDATTPNELTKGLGGTSAVYINFLALAGGSGDTKILQLVGGVYAPAKEWGYVNGGSAAMTGNPITKCTRTPLTNVIDSSYNNSPKYGMGGGSHYTKGDVSFIYGAGPGIAGAIVITYST